MHHILGKRLTQLVLGLLAGTALVPFVLPQIILAQSLDRDPSQDFQRQDNNDAVYGSGTGQGFSVFDMIHRANLGNNRSIEDFSVEQRENLDSAAAEFKAQQRERLQIQQNQAAPGNPASTVTPAQGN
ncbi:hypothetical protein [Argonema galeatum]|uniref:hypothetical protein n=1 Tax=Argonema galeatum TaxID=2942762 RepID=UPI002012310B|nr:hypothetical protein [Argonema galeatum]MCL1466371.1 hypothetical protein [Argonema galeatum A003/A1]